MSKVVSDQDLNNPLRHIRNFETGTKDGKREDYSRDPVNKKNDPVIQAAAKMAARANRGTVIEAQQSSAEHNASKVGSDAEKHTEVQDDVEMEELKRRYAAELDKMNY